MASSENTLPATRRSRKSIGGHMRGSATVDIAKASSPAKNQRKSRSKSMGPGGLDALKPVTGNRRVSLAASARPPPRSILKPTIPLAEIPPHKPRPSSHADTDQENDDRTIRADEHGASGTRVAVRTEEEQQAAVREREERERVQAEAHAASEREARRKSLANRRVSFAAEATLHTFHEIEYLQDSTTSTDSTRRASSLAARSPAPAVDQGSASDPSEPPSTPPEQVEESVPESPANQRGLHQKQRRRSSGASTLTLDHAHEKKGSNSGFDSDTDSGDEVVEIQTEEVSDSSQDSDEEDGTMMTIDEMTSASVASVATAHSGSSANSTSDLDENLRLAAERARAGQQDTVEHVPAAADEDDDDGEEVIPSFTGWIKKPAVASASASDNIDQDAAVNADLVEAGEETAEVDMDMDMTDNTGGIILQPAMNPPIEAQEEDMSMEVTSALGGILAQPEIQSHRQTILRSPQRPVHDESALGDEPMDFTVAVGGIKSSRDSAVSDIEGYEDMSMELTTAIGGLLSTSSAKAWAPSGRRRSLAPKQGKSTNNESADETVGMDMSMPVGRIIQSSSPVRSQVTRTPSPVRQKTAAPIIAPAAKVQNTNAMDGPAPQTPDLAAFRGKGLRRSPIVDDEITPIRTPTTKSTPAKMIGSRSASPKRLDTLRRPRELASPSKQASRSPGLFSRHPSTGATTPKVILTPQPRRLSGLGADRIGLGSPKVAAILDRRTSLGDAAADFVPSHDAGPLRRKVAFDDPRTLEREIERERQEDEDKENGRKILEREADGDATLTLREMISGLSPKKPIGKGRKSLHVGSAKGLLGKRPAELDDDDDDDDDDEQDGVKRLKNHQGSPVKNVRLQAPPSKAETTGRMTRARRIGLGDLDDGLTTPTVTLTTAEDGNGVAATTPKDQGRFRKVQDDHLSTEIDFSRCSPAKGQDSLGEMGDDGEQRIHLQDFLNMTNIRFLELTTTKRRHTVAPGAAPMGAADDGGDDSSLERCVVASACTVPMLELYQHSCRELKKYISEGRRIVKEIETEAFEENPPLFREYLSASSEVRSLMDSQFKNVKAHARLLSKAMWYEWRMKLQDGLKEGLAKMMEGMAEDKQSLEKQRRLLDASLPELTKRFEMLEREYSDLEAAAQELADCDPEDLEAARLDIVRIDKDIEAKKAKMAELEQQLQDTDAGIEDFKEQKQSCLESISASDKVREECRGWTAGEVAALRDRAEALEKERGWAITGITGTVMSMTYHREIELVFDAASFPSSTGQAAASNARIDLWYIAASRERDPLPLTPEKDFMVQCIRDLTRSLLPSQVKAGALLRAVSASWDVARALARQVRLVQTTFRTEVIKTSDASITIRVPMVLPELESKVEVDFCLSHHASGQVEGGVQISVAPRASVVYGEAFNAPKMGEYLGARVGSTMKVLGTEGRPGLWLDALLELRTRLLARGRKTAA